MRLSVGDNARAIEADVVVGAFAAESALRAHIGDADQIVAAVGVFPAFDIVLAFVHGVADASIAAFGVAEAFRASDACAIEADLARFAIAVDRAGARHEACAVNAEAAFALRAEHAFDFFGCVADICLAGDAAPFSAEHIGRAVGIDLTFGFCFADAVVAGIAVEAVSRRVAFELELRLAGAFVAEAVSATVGIGEAFRSGAGFADAIVADIAVRAVAVLEAVRS